MRDSSWKRHEAARLAPEQLLDVVHRARHSRRARAAPRPGRASPRAGRATGRARRRNCRARRRRAFGQLARARATAAAGPPASPPAAQSARICASSAAAASSWAPPSAPRAGCRSRLRRGFGASAGRLASNSRTQRAPPHASAAGFGPPAIQSSNCTVCTTGTLARELGDAADIARRDHVRPGAGDVAELALPQPRRDRRLQQVVGARRAAAEMRLGRLRDLEPGPAQQRLRRLQHPLPVLQAAGRVIGHAQRRAPPGSARSRSRPGTPRCPWPAPTRARPASRSGSVRNMKP